MIWGVSLAQGSHATRNVPVEIIVTTPPFVLSSSCSSAASLYQGGLSQLLWPPPRSCLQFCNFLKPFRASATLSSCLLAPSRCILSPLRATCSFSSLWLLRYSVILFPCSCLLWSCSFSKATTLSLGELVGTLPTAKFGFTTLSSLLPQTQILLTPCCVSTKNVASHINGRRLACCIFKLSHMTTSTMAQTNVPKYLISKLAILHTSKSLLSLRFVFYFPLLKNLLSLRLLCALHSKPSLKTML